MSLTGRGPMGKPGKGRGTFGEVRDGSGDSRVGPVEVGDPRGGPGWFGKWRDGSRDPRGAPRRLGGPSGRSLTGRGTLGEVLDGSGDPWGGPGRFVKWWEGRGTLGELRDGLLDPRGGLGLVSDPRRGPKLVRGLSGWSETVRETLAEIWNGSGDSRGGSLRVGEP